MLVVNGMLFWSSVKGFCKADLVIITVEYRVVELHEIITADKEIIETRLADIECSNRMFALAFSLDVGRIGLFLHPMVRWDGVVNTIDDICQITIPML